MTQEEKAKAYDEALERARALRQEAIDKEYAIDYVKDYEAIFPQLAESEDEMVRQWLLDYAIEMIAGLESDISRSTYDGIKGHDPEAEAELAQWRKARAYLERQKEQKPAEWTLPEDFEEAVYKVANFISPFDNQEELRKTSHRFADQLLSLAKKELARQDEVITLDKLAPYDKGFQDGKAVVLKDLPRWRKWENGAGGNSDGIPIAIVKRGIDYKLVSSLGIQGEQYIMLSDLEKLPGFNVLEMYNPTCDTSTAKAEE